MEKYTLTGVPASKKNSKQIVYNKKSKKPIIVSSKRYQDWHRIALAEILPQCTQPPITKCDNVRVDFYIKGKRKRDNTNMVESVHDLLVDAKIIEDDNYFVMPNTEQHYHEAYEDKVLITIT